SPRRAGAPRPPRPATAMRRERRRASAPGPRASTVATRWIPPPPHPGCSGPRRHLSGRRCRAWVRCGPMELRIFTEPQQGATYDDLLAVALEAERLGFGAFFRSDHYLHMGGSPGPGSTDAWTTLAGLARDTSTIR